MTQTNECTWVLKAWSQGALVSARAEVRRLRKSPEERSALNELAIALHGARKYAEMAGQKVASQRSEEAEDEVFAMRSEGRTPTAEWLDALTARIEAAESALMGDGDGLESSEPPAPTRHRTWQGFAKAADWEHYL